jgi:hypothetical protein
MSYDAFALRSTNAPAAHEEHLDANIPEREPRVPERVEDELIMHLERDQFVAETSRPLPRAVLSARVTFGLWALRIFGIVVGLMVLYTFVDQLH